MEVEHGQVMRRFAPAVLLCCAALTAGCQSERSSPPATAAAPADNPVVSPAIKRSGPHVGAWRSIWSEQHKVSGEPLPPPDRPEDDNSVIIYDGVGHWADANVPLSHLRSKSAEQMTPDEAKEVVAAKAPRRSAAQLFGTYLLNAQDKYVVNHVLGVVDPVVKGTDRFRLFEFTGNRVFLKFVPLTRSDQIMWRQYERLPDLEQVTAAHRKLIGFWKTVAHERRKPSGEVVASIPLEDGYVIYTTSGYVQIHLMQPNRKNFAAVNQGTSRTCTASECVNGGEPTPAEAKAALTSYIAYTGPYTIDESKNLLTYRGLGPVSGQRGPDAQHSYEVSGNRLILKSPPMTIDGQEVQVVITAERVSGDRPADQP